MTEVPGKRAVVVQDSESLVLQSKCHQVKKKTRLTSFEEVEPPPLLQPDYYLRDKDLPKRRASGVKHLLFIYDTRFRCE